MSTLHTDRWERVLLITACGAIREHQIPEPDLGKDIFVKIMKRFSVWHEGWNVEQEAKVYERRFVFDGEFYGRSGREMIYREQI